MLLLRSAATLFVFLVATPTQGATSTFPLDPYHSQAIILVDHFGVSRMGGLMGGLLGGIDIDPETMSISKIDITIPVDSFVSTHPPRTNAVKGELLLDAANHPEIHFASSKIEKREKDQVATGTITIRGISKEVTFPMLVRGPQVDPFGVPRVGFEGELTVSRKDFEIAFDRKLPDGSPVLGDEVSIQFQVEALKGAPGRVAPAGPQKGN
jgi:polyisoprenoid-binding protein YceI